MELIDGVTYRYRLTTACGGVRVRFREEGGFRYLELLDEPGCMDYSDGMLLSPLIEEPEQDPNGIDQHDNGAKLDAGKPMAGRLLGMFGGALMAVSEVGTFGAKKYTEGGWQHVEDGFKRYDDAGMRHFLKRGMGEEFDADSELPHLAHEAWNALAKLELYLRDKKQN
ncbi:hypothetical protein NVP1243O_26 [Vibrio phage 1.243.O._10N.261.54.B5]|nr:hypothetical protein NVP1243O_26 [Vibrio phage 1.243.O._10N.261.54.B5]